MLKKGKIKRVEPYFHDKDYLTSIYKLPQLILQFFASRNTKQHQPEAIFYFL